jgi:general stress protein 26
MPVLVLASFVVGLVWQAPSPPAPERTREMILDSARQIMTKARYCALVTLGPDGHPHAREIDAFAPESDLTVWIATNPVTRKVKEIQQDSRVTLYYAAENASGYVTILGHAQVVNDAGEKSSRWKENWAGFYADKNRGPDYVLIRVRPVNLEIVSYPDKLVNDPKTWRPISIDFPREARGAHARGTFDVKLAPQGSGDSADGTSLGRMSIAKTYYGPLAGSARGEMLSAMTGTKDSAGYVALERVSGTLDGRKGTFILQHSGTMNRGAQHLTISVVPDSGTGELAGLAGTMGIRIEGGQHFYEFDYSLPERR